MECVRSDSQRLREQLTAAIDLKEAASAKDPFQAHMTAAEREVVRETDAVLEQEMESAHPRHDKLEKLISLKGSLKAAHIMVTPEEEVWREEVDNAMK